MNKSDKKLLLKEMNERKALNREQYRLMLQYYIEAYVHSILVYGINDEITIETKNIWNNFVNVTKEEKLLYEYIQNNNSLIELSSALELIDRLDEVNDETITYYIDAFDDILDSCEMKVKWRAQHRKKNFYTLLETDEFRLDTVGLTLSIQDIKNYFNYSDDFWNYVEEKTAYLDNNIEENSMFYSVLMRFDKNNRLSDIRIYVPIIVDLKTALINIHEFKHAHDLYLKLGEEINNEEDLEITARNQEKDFIDNYVKVKIK